MAALPQDAAGAGSGFPPTVGRPALRALALAGITDYAQLTQGTAADVLALHGVGPKAIRLLTAELHARGLSFVDGASAAEK